jgi:hypothetical protein
MVWGVSPNKYGPHPSWIGTTLKQQPRRQRSLLVALADLAVRRATLPSLYVWIPWRCCIWSTWIGRTTRASQEGCEQQHCLLPSTRSFTSRWFRCICTSIGNLVIYNSSSSWFMGSKILFCASVATPYPSVARWLQLSRRQLVAANLRAITDPLITNITRCSPAHCCGIWNSFLINYESKWLFNCSYNLYTSKDYVENHVSNLLDKKIGALTCRKVSSSSCKN